MDNGTSVISQVFDWLDNADNPSVEALVQHGILQGWPLNTCTTYHQRWKKHRGKVAARKQQGASNISLIVQAQTANAQCRIAVDAAMRALDESTAALAVLLTRQNEEPAKIEQSMHPAEAPKKLTPVERMNACMVTAASYPSEEAFKLADPAGHNNYVFITRTTGQRDPIWETK